MKINVKSEPVRLKDVAEAAGVSSCTASRALNGVMLNKVSEETRQRIIKIADSMGYRPNIMARGLAKKRTNLIGVLVPEIRTSFLPQTMEGIWSAAENANMAVLLYVTDWSAQKEEKYLRQLVEWQVDGIIWVPNSTDNINLFIEVEQYLPVIQLFMPVPELHSSKVILDNEKGGYLATQHLINLGHKKIAHFTAINGHFASSGKERLQGYLRALRKAKLPVDNNLIVDSGFTTKGGRKAFQQVAKYQPTAVFACSDMVAWGCIQEAKLNGKSVPDELAVVGFDNLDIANLVVPSLTTIEQPQRQFGELAVTKLLEALDNEIYEEVVLEPRLIKRQSS